MAGTTRPRGRKRGANATANHAAKKRDHRSPASIQSTVPNFARDSEIWRQLEDDLTKGPEQFSDPRHRKIAEQHCAYNITYKNLKANAVNKQLVDTHGADAPANNATKKRDWLSGAWDGSSTPATDGRLQSHSDAARAYPQDSTALLWPLPQYNTVPKLADNTPPSATQKTSPAVNGTMRASHTIPSSAHGSEMWRQPDYLPHKRPKTNATANQPAHTQPQCDDTVAPVVTGKTADHSIFIHDTTSPPPDAFDAKSIMDYHFASPVGTPKENDEKEKEKENEEDNEYQQSPGPQANGTAALPNKSESSLQLPLQKATARYNRVLPTDNDLLLQAPSLQGDARANMLDKSKSLPDLRSRKR
jgi:hypothetical protein